jgi:hypothetical protein
VVLQQNGEDPPKSAVYAGLSAEVCEEGVEASGVDVKAAKDAGDVGSRESLGQQRVAIDLEPFQSCKRYVMVKFLLDCLFQHSVQPHLEVFVFQRN